MLIECIQHSQTRELSKHTLQAKQKCCTFARLNILARPTRMPGWWIDHQSDFQTGKQLPNTQQALMERRLSSEIIRDSARFYTPKNLSALLVSNTIQKSPSAQPTARKLAGPQTRRSGIQAQAIDLNQEGCLGKARQRRCSLKKKYDHCNGR